MGIQFIVVSVLGLLGVDALIILIVVDLVIALVFTYIRFRPIQRATNTSMWRMPEFHKQFSIQFLILLALTFLFNFVF